MEIGSRNTMVMSYFRPEVKIQPFRACAMHPAIIIGTDHSLWTWLWGRYHVPQNAFLVFVKFHMKHTSHQPQKQKVTDVPYSLWYIFNVIPNTDHNAHPTNPNHNNPNPTNPTNHNIRYCCEYGTLNSMFAL